ncbi:hypothetical protein [Heyndrickxia acidiproducens]|uniref:hypothetical protein n=1 Tax=Heyndrickxia acidiproducens TaxID=1121084 RepID=UPI0003672AC8|nr:hypothetical protein [Heyndrickxia acidiproducens]
MKQVNLILAAVLMFLITGCSSSQTPASPSKKSENAGTEHATNPGEKGKSGNSSSPNSAASLNESNQNTEDDNSSPSSSAQSEIKEKTTKNGSEETSEDHSDSSSSNSNKIKISSGDAAIKYLKGKIEEESNRDILFDDMGGTLSTDEKGSYYTVTLYSKSLRQAGGSGTVGIYKVYQNGTYKGNNRNNHIQTNTDENDQKKAVSLVKDYLRSRNELIEDKNHFVQYDGVINHYIIVRYSTLVSGHSSTNGRYAVDIHNGKIEDITNNPNFNG